MIYLTLTQGYELLITTVRPKILLSILELKPYYYRLTEKKSKTVKSLLENPSARYIEVFLIVSP